MAEGKRGAFYSMLEEFHKYWERIDIICPKISNKSLAIGKNFFGNVFVHPSQWPLFFQSWWISKKGHEIYREHKFDLITVHEYPPFYNGIGARLLWNKIGVPYILEIHHIPGYPRAADFKEWLYKIATHYLIKYDAIKAEAVRVVNQRQVPEFLINSGVPKEKIVYIPSFYIDLDIFRPMDPVRSFARVKGASPEDLGGATSSGVKVKKKYDLIFVGRLAKNKGIDLLLQAISNIKIQMPDIKLLLVGDGPLTNFLKFKIENLKLRDNVTLYGWAKDPKEIAELLNRSRLLIMSSYNEGGPRVVLEAMACGVPVLATRVGIVTDILKDGESGGIIDWNPVDILQKAAELLGNTSKYQKYRINGLEVAGHFEKQAAIKNYAQKLVNLLH